MVTWLNFCWVCAADLSEPLTYYSLFCVHIIDPILVTVGKKVIFTYPNLVTFCLCFYLMKSFPKMNCHIFVELNVV